MQGTGRCMPGYFAEAGRIERGGCVRDALASRACRRVLQSSMEAVGGGEGTVVVDGPPTGREEARGVYEEEPFDAFSSSRAETSSAGLLRRLLVSCGGGGGGGGGVCGCCGSRGGAAACSAPLRLRDAARETGFAP